MTNAEARPSTPSFGHAWRVAPPDARSGLIAFLRHGMWEWVRTLTLLGRKPLPVSPLSASHQTKPGERRGVIHLLAALTINDRRKS